jgi:DNA-binding CsgD family transcriptional regulator
MGGWLSEAETSRLAALVHALGGGRGEVADPFAHVVSELRQLTDAKLTIAFATRARGQNRVMSHFQADGCPDARAPFERCFAEMPNLWSAHWPSQANVACRAVELLDDRRGRHPAFTELITSLGTKGCDAIRVSIPLDHASLAWVGAFREKPFTARDAYVLESLVAPLRARLPLEDRLGNAAIHGAALTAALAAIPAAAFVLSLEGTVAEANTKGRELLAHDEVGTRERLRQSVAGAQSPAPFVVTPLSAHTEPPHFLAVEHDRSGGVALRVARATAAWPLSERQGAVLARLARGCSNKAIAESIGCSAKTVEVHVLSLLRKFGVQNRTELVANFWTIL